MSIDERVASIETAIININATLVDFKHDMNRNFDKIEQKFENIDRRFIALEERLDHKLESQGEKYDKKMAALEQRIDRKFDAINNRIWINVIWTMGSFAGLAGLIAHAQHWL